MHARKRVAVPLQMVVLSLEVVDREMGYLLNVENERRMLRISAGVFLAFCCAAPVVLLFSTLVVFGLRSFIH